MRRKLIITLSILGLALGSIGFSASKPEVKKGGNCPLCAAHPSACLEQPCTSTCCK